MIWIILAVLSAVFRSVQRLFEKSLSSKIGPFSLGWITQIFSLPLIVVVFLWDGDFFNPFTLPLSFWLPMGIILVFLFPLQTYAYYRAIKEGDLSEVLPILSLSPVFSIFISWLLLGETPTLLGVLGILMIVAAVYFLRLKSNDSLLLPFRHLLRHKASIFMLFASLTMALGGSLDKMAINASSAAYYNFANTLGSGIIFFVIALLLQKDNDFSFIRKSIPTLLSFGLIAALSYTLYILALSSNFVAYVSAIRSSNVVIGSVLGILFLREELTKQKLFSLVLIILGLGLIGFR